MSWGIDVTGTPAAVKKAVAEQLDRTAASYKGLPEADDIAMCKARALALVDTLVLELDGYVNWNGVVVRASGSHSTTSRKAGGTGVVGGNFELKVMRTVLALDEALPVPPPEASAPATT